MFLFLFFLYIYPLSHYCDILTVLKKVSSTLLSEMEKKVCLFVNSLQTFKHNCRSSAAVKTHLVPFERFSTEICYSTDQWHEMKVTQTFNGSLLDIKFGFVLKVELMKEKQSWKRGSICDLISHPPLLLSAFFRLYQCIKSVQEFTSQLLSNLLIY